MSENSDLKDILKVINKLEGLIYDLQSIKPIVTKLEDNAQNINVKSSNALKNINTNPKYGDEFERQFEKETYQNFYFLESKYRYEITHLINMIEENRELLEALSNLPDSELKRKLIKELNENIDKLNKKWNVVDSSINDIIKFKGVPEKKDIINLEEKTKNIINEIKEFSIGQEQFESSLKSKIKSLVPTYK